jgi:hypothetical protein
VGRPAPARARLNRARAFGTATLVAIVLAIATRAAAGQPVAAPITGGAPTVGYPAVGALIAGADPTIARTECSGVLVGCRTFLTAAHCLCNGTGAECQGDAAPSASGWTVFFAHDGFVPIERITIHPDFVFPLADLAVVKLAREVTGIAPAPVNGVATPPFGTPGTTVGFGWQTPAARDTGIKRAGAVTTAPCTGGISNETSVCWDHRNAGANTCQGDSGGPLFVDLGAGPVVAGTTSGGFAVACTANDHSYDANLFLYRSWLATAAEGDLDTSGCGGIPAVDAAGTVATGVIGDLGSIRPFALESVGVAPGTSELRVGLMGSEAADADFDLYVRSGAAPAPHEFDCSGIGSGQYAFCRIANPSAGSWFLRAERVRGEGVFQLVATTVGGAASICGNGIREPGEKCDGSDTGTCTTGCDASCDCVVCSATDLDVPEIIVAPRLFVQATIGDGTGTYTAVDPASAGVTIELIDDLHAVPIVIPARDPRWIIVNPRRGKYRWRGGPASPVKKVEFRIRKKAPTEFAIRVQGRNLPGASALDYQSLIVRVRLGSRCAERRFHSEAQPAFPRR